MLARTNRLAVSNSAEREAVAALLSHLRREHDLHKVKAIILELAVGKYANRVDVAIVDDLIHCYEIKTERDDLSRLENQITAYSSMSDLVSVVLATKHLRNAMQMLPAHVGVKELKRSKKGLELIEIRAPHRYFDWSMDACLQILPVVEIRRALPKSSRLKRRNEIMACAASLDKDNVRDSLRKFLSERYAETTQGFLKFVRGKAINADDLHLLRLWRRARHELANADISVQVHDVEDVANIAYEFIGRSFGPVPDDIKKLLSN